MDQCTSLPPHFLNFFEDVKMSKDGMSTWQAAKQVKRKILGILGGRLLNSNDLASQTSEVSQENFE